MKHTIILSAVLLLTTTAHAQHVDCEEKINPFHPCHRWVDNTGGGMAKAAARGPSEGNNSAPGPAAGSAGPAGPSGPGAGNPGTAPGKGPGAAPGKGDGKGHGHGGPKGGGKGHGSHGGHGKGKAK